MARSDLLKATRSMLLPLALVGIVVLQLAGLAMAQTTPPEQISIVYCADCVPFHFRDDSGKPAGMIIEFWRKWSEKTGVKLDFKAADWDETIRLVKDGQVDVHAGLFFNEERAKFLEYGDGASLVETGTHYFVDKKLPLVNNMEDLAAHRVGVITGDFVEGYLKKRIPPENIIGFSNFDAIMAALRDGRIKVFAADTPTGIFHLQKAGLGFAYVFPADQPLYRNKWHIAAATKHCLKLLSHIH